VANPRGTFVLLRTLVALSRVSDRDAGLAASLPNVGQQVGGSIGLALAGHGGLDRDGQHRPQFGRVRDGRSQGGSPAGRDGRADQGGDL
jgi:hypothetical protein